MPFIKREGLDPKKSLNDEVIIWNSNENVIEEAKSYIKFPAGVIRNTKSYVLLHLDMSGFNLPNEEQIHFDKLISPKLIIKEENIGKAPFHIVDILTDGNKNMTIYKCDFDITKSSTFYKKGNNIIVCDSGIVPDKLIPKGYDDCFFAANDESVSVIVGTLLKNGFKKSKVNKQMAATFV